MCTWMYAVWLVILLTAPSIDGQATELVITPKTLVAKLMLEATAFCKPEGNPEPKELEWWGPYEREKGKITDDISQRVHVKLAQNNKDLQLYIREVWPEDQGEYTCEARANGQPIVRPLTVSVYQDITIVDAPPLQNPVIYTNALIKCKVEGNPKPQVQWIRGGTETINAGGRYTYEPDGLRIENILETDNDLYICRAYVAETGAARSIDITVEVHIPPEINIPPAASFGVEGFDATMSCYSLGKPTPEYEWLKGNQPLNNPIKYPQSGNELRVTKLTKIPDESTYSCKAVNPAGEDKASAFLDVIVPPKVQVNVNKTEIASPKDVYVNCTVSGEPRPTVSWWKIGKDKPYVEDTQPDDSRITIKAENGPQYPGEIPSTISRLRIINTRHSDNGVYRCQGNNQAVELLRDDELRQIWPPYRIENELIVFSRPVIDRRNPWLYWSWIDHTINLTCFAEGEPKAGITWWLNGIQVVYNIYFQLFGTNQLSFLQVTTKNPADFGTYQCVAYNSQGEDTMDIELKEGLAPRRPPTVKISLVTPTTVTFDIVRPDDPGNLPLNGYHVEYKLRDASWDLAMIYIFPSAGPYILDGLWPETQYTVVIQARNQAGAGYPTTEMVVETSRIRVPYQPLLVEDFGQTHYSDRYLLRWKEPADGGRLINHYQISYEPLTCQGDNQNDQQTSCTLEKAPPLISIVIPAPAASYMIRELYSGQKYRVEVRAHNSVGHSDTDSMEFSTEPGDNPYTEYVVPALSSGGIIGIIIVCVLVIAVVVDLLLCMFCNCGIIFYCFVDACGRDNPEEFEMKASKGSGQTSISDMGQENLGIDLQEKQPEQAEEERTAAEKNMPDILVVTNTPDAAHDIDYEEDEDDTEEDEEEEDERETKPHSSSRDSTEASLDAKPSLLPPPVPRHLKPTGNRSYDDDDYDDVKKPYVTESDDDDIGDSKDLQLSSSDDDDHHKPPFAVVPKPVVFDPRYSKKTAPPPQQQQQQQQRSDWGKPLRPPPPPPAVPRSDNGGHPGPYGSRELYFDEPRRDSAPTAQGWGSREMLRGAAPGGWGSQDPPRTGYGFGYETDPPPPTHHRSLDDSRLPESQPDSNDYDQDYKPWGGNGYMESAA